jgi:hypothetical protein
MAIQGLGKLNILPTVSGATGGPGLGDITGSVPDVVGMVLGLSEAMSAKEGFNVNNLVFILKLASGQQASAKGNQGSFTMLPPQHAFFRVQEITRKSDSFGGPVRAESDDTVQVGLRCLRFQDNVICAVELRQLEGWDTKLFSQIALEVVVTEINDGALLTVFGFVDPAGAGFGRFIGQILCQWGGNFVTTKPVGEPSITANTHRLFVQNNETGFALISADNNETMELWEKAQRRKF